MDGTGQFEDRLAFFRGREHGRYWWFAATGYKYLPFVFQTLDEAEWAVLKDWYLASEAAYSYGTGECNVPSISFLISLLSGNDIRRVVQCGHFIGYSSLLMGFALRRMRAQHALFSIDINEDVTRFSQSWLERAGLTDQVHLELSDSAAPAMASKAEAYLGGKPQIVFIDSSHEYAHTLQELDLWYTALQPGGFIVLHDVSRLASDYNALGQGGVRAAAMEWTARNHAPCLLINSDSGNMHYGDRVTYMDACGLGLIQKPDPDPVPQAA